MNPLVTPLEESAATDKVEQTFGRIKEMLGTSEVPMPFLVYARVPAYLQDFFMNVKRFVFADGKLSAKTKSLIAFAQSAQFKSGPWTDFFHGRSIEAGWTEEQLTEAVAVAAACATYNTFFKFRDLAGKDIFQGMPVGLRAHTFSGTSLDDATVELINIVISNANSCHACVSGHVQKAVDLDVSEEAILEAVQSAAVMAGGIAFLSAAGY